MFTFRQTAGGSDINFEFGEFSGKIDFTRDRFSSLCFKKTQLKISSSFGLIIDCFDISDRGLCLPTVSLWLLFVYVEASVRLRELKNLPFHLDLCRPFAAHW